MDIKNMKEILIASNEMALEVIKLTKDGVQPASDAIQLVADLMGPLKDQIMAAISDASLAVAEAKDLDAVEAFELAAMQLEYAKKIYAALKA